MTRLQGSRSIRVEAGTGKGASRDVSGCRPGTGRDGLLSATTTGVRTSRSLSGKLEEVVDGSKSVGRVVLPRLEEGDGSCARLASGMSASRFGRALASVSTRPASVRQTTACDHSDTRDGGAENELMQSRCKHGCGPAPRRSLPPSLLTRTRLMTPPPCAAAGPRRPGPCPLRSCLLQWQRGFRPRRRQSGPRLPRARPPRRHRRSRAPGRRR